MMRKHDEKADWDPREAQTLENQIATYDQMRRRCPVARSQFLHCSVFRHRDVLKILEDHETFSNLVSRHLSVPNGMDPPEHGRYRAIVEPYFSASKMAAFEPQCRTLVRELIATLPRNRPVEMVASLARLELRVLMQELMAGLSGVSQVPGDTEERARFPAGGFRRLPLVFDDNA